MNKTAKVIDLREYKDRKLVGEKYSQFRDISANIGKSIQDAKDFIEFNRLYNVRSNHRTQADLAALCQRDIENLRKQFKALSSIIEITESVADVLPFVQKKKAA